MTAFAAWRCSWRHWESSGVNRNSPPWLAPPSQRLFGRRRAPIMNGRSSSRASALPRVNPPIIYALVRASEFLGEDEWLQHALRFAEMLDAERITSDRKFDLLSGAAGAALALLALYRATQLPEALEKAVLCGEHLLQHRSASQQGPRAWKTISEEMLTGFSHGAAGIAYALLKLYEATGENSFREAALEAEAL